MTDQVWKFVLPAPTASGRAYVDMPATARPVSVGIQAGELVVWALCDPDYEIEDGYVSPHGPRRFIVANTGTEIPGFPGNARFLGTVTASTGVVWHVWDGDARTPA